MKPLTESLKEFCQTQELLRFAYVDGQGYPHVVPLWFSIIEGSCYVGTGAKSVKRKSVQRNPRIGWVIDGGERDHYKAASCWGHVDEVNDPDLRARVYQALGVKYFGSPDVQKFVEIYGKVDDRDTVYWKLIPEDGTSWEY
jgi:nitroimidazol reductase NimA-like FMN-containing flavoprotein (pyridoxamine 5'-phosphate oxidase superfamily)